MFTVRAVLSLVVLSLALLSFASTSSAQLPVPYSSCATGKTLFTISNVTANEWPPKKGTDLSVLFDGVVLENVTDGRYEISVTWESIVPVYDEKGDIKVLLLNQSLPVNNGTFCYLSKTVSLSSDIPDGSYVVKIEAWDTPNNNVFTCFEVKFKFDAIKNQPLIHNPTPLLPPAPADLPSRPVPNHAGPYSVPAPHRLKLRRERKN